MKHRWLSGSRVVLRALVVDWQQPCRCSEREDRAEYHQPGKDPDSKLQVRFLLNTCHFHTIVKSKIISSTTVRVPPVLINDFLVISCKKTVIIKK